MYSFDKTTDRSNTGSSKWLFAPEPVKNAGVLPLSVADMELPTAPEVTAAVCAAAEKGIYGYTVADDEYLSSVCSWCARRHGWRVEPDWILPSSGIVGFLGVAVRELTEPDDGVIVQTPVYYPFMMSITGNGRRVVEAPLINDGGRYSMDFAALENAVKDAKLLILSSPHNPVGRVWTRGELQRLFDICRAAGVTVIADEIHWDMLLPGVAHTAFGTLDGAEKGCIMCTSASKTFNLAGLNCSSVIVPDAALRERLDARLDREGSFGIPFFARVAVIAAYTRGEAWLDELLEYIGGNFEYLYSYMAMNHPSVVCARAEGTYLAWTDLRPLALGDIKEQEKLMTERALLALDEGYIFGSGGEGFERWNLAVPRSELVAALERFTAAVGDR